MRTQASSDGYTAAGTCGPPQKLSSMNLEETIAVAIGIVVAISFLAIFLFGGFGISLS